MGVPKISNEEAWKIARWMRENDRFAALLGIELLEVEPGYCKVSMKVTGDMLNAVRVTHGGVTFALADFAFAVACNVSHKVSLALQAGINFTAPSKEGDTLFATAREASRGAVSGLYQVEVAREGGRVVGHFSGTSFQRDDLMADWMEKFKLPEEQGGDES